jgi:hypothetical protein
MAVVTAPKRVAELVASKVRQLAAWMAVLMVDVTVSKWVERLAENSVLVMVGTMAE